MSSGTAMHRRNAEKRPAAGRRRIKVLHIWKDLDTYYGVHDQLLTLARHIDRTAFALTLCVFGNPKGPLAGAFEQADVPVVSPGVRGAGDPLLLPRLTALLRRERPHVVQTYCLNTNVFGTLAARLAGVPAVIATELTRRDQAGSAVKRLRDSLLYPLVLSAYRLADGVVFVSDHVKSDWVGARRSSKYRTIYSPFNDLKVSEAAPGRTREPGHGHDVTIGIVARLSPEKGHEDLLRALPRVLAAYPRARLLIVGTGPCEDALKGLADRLGVSAHVCFVGHKEDVAGQMRAMDVFVHPSRSEGMGIAIVEAMVLGLPVVATDHGGIPEVVSAGDTGILVPPRNPRRLAEAVVGILDRPAEARAMGARARRAALVRFHPGVFTRRHEELYRKLVDAKARGAARSPSPRARRSGAPAHGERGTAI